MFSQFISGGISFGLVGVCLSALIVAIFYRFSHELKKNAIGFGVAFSFICVARFLYHFSLPSAIITICLIMIPVIVLCMAFDEIIKKEDEVN